MDEIEEELRSLSDDEKLERLEYETNYHYIKILIMSLKSDKYKLQILYKLESYDQVELFESLEESDEIKLEYIKKATCSEYDKLRIAKSIKSDEIKLQSLDLFDEDSEYSKTEIIQTLNTDENKIRAMKQHIKNSFNHVEIVKGFVSRENKIRCLNFFTNEYDIQKIMSDIELKTDEERTLIVSALNYSNSSYRYIIQIEDETKRIELLRKIKGDYEKTQIIMTLSTDDDKIAELRNLRSELNKVDVIKTLRDDKKKIAELGNLREYNDDYTKASVIITLGDESIKIEELQKLTDEFAKLEVIATLNDPELQLKEIQKLKSEVAKAVALAKSNFGDRIKEIEKLDDELARAIGIHISNMNFPIDDYWGGISQSLREDVFIDREKLKEMLLEKDRKYTKIGLDEHITIGMEIECEGQMSETLKLIENIVHRQNGSKLWQAKGDGSLERGVEVVSPILTDSIEDVEDVYIICSMLQRCGETVNGRCGGHIHIGADYLKSKEAYINLFEIWGNAEEIIYKISNEKGSTPREGTVEFAVPISSKLNQAVEQGTINLETEDDLDEFISQIQSIQGRDRFYGLNLLNIKKKEDNGLAFFNMNTNNGKNTIEFRIPNGSINPDIWIENARLFGRIVQVSQRLAEIENQPEISQKDQELLSLRDFLKEDAPEQEKMEALLKLLFSEEERGLYRERYISSTRLLEQMQIEKNPLKKANFSKVDFKKKMHCKNEFHEIAIKSRIGEISGVISDTIQMADEHGNFEQSSERDEEEK